MKSVRRMLRGTDLALLKHVRDQHTKFSSMSATDQQDELARQRAELEKRAIEKMLEEAGN